MIYFLSILYIFQMKIGCCVSLGASWEGLRASWEGLRASWEGLGASWEAPKPASQLVGPQSQVGGTRGMEERELSIHGMWWYHRSSSPTKPLPKKDGPGPVMVSYTLCPAVHILGT